MPVSETDPNEVLGDALTCRRYEGRSVYFASLFGRKHEVLIAFAIGLEDRLSSTKLCVLIVQRDLERCFWNNVAGSFCAKSSI